jgi:bacterioferritin (cytochrome b1)
MSILSPVEQEIWLYSYYRDAELHGANLLFRLMRRLEDDESQINLTRHLADEVRHAWLWTERIRDLGAAPVPVHDGYQTRIRKHAGIPRQTVDLLALTVVVEQRALKRYHEHMKREDLPAPTRDILDAVTADEAWHIDWIRRKGRGLAELQGGAALFDDALERYREVDRTVVGDMLEKERILGGR